MSFKTPKDDRKPTWRGKYTEAAQVEAAKVATVRLLSKLSHIVDRGGILAVTACGIQFDATQRDLLYVPWEEVGCGDCLAKVASDKLVSLGESLETLIDEAG